MAFQNAQHFHIAIRWQQSHRSESQLFRNVKGNKLEDWYFVKQKETDMDSAFRKS